MDLNIQFNILYIYIYIHCNVMRKNYSIEIINKYKIKFTNSMN